MIITYIKIIFYLPGIKRRRQQQNTHFIPRTFCRAALESASECCLIILHNFNMKNALSLALFFNIA